jgi:serine/threonine protein phosphatase PrpC
MTTKRKPRDDELDAFGITHTGKVRKENQDQFLLATIHKRMQVTISSLGANDLPMFADQRMAVIAMVADGVGGGFGGQKASATALQVIAEYVGASSDCFLTADTAEEEFIQKLQAAAMRSHEAVRERAKREAEGRAMATTLTLWFGVWPWYYILQVGDSRYYLYHEGKLTQVSRDQTIAQDLFEKGIFTRATAERSRLSDVLSSAIGADEAMPVVTRLQSDWKYVHLLCTDGLTKHVSDERIAERLRTMTSAKQVCEALLQDALDGGGTDNITIIVGRALERPEPVATPPAF